jgi:hypothetical protein
MTIGRGSRPLSPDEIALAQDIGLILCDPEGSNQEDYIIASEFGLLGSVPRFIWWLGARPLTKADIGKPISLSFS